MLKRRVIPVQVWCAVFILVLCGTSIAQIDAAAVRLNWLEIGYSPYFTQPTTKHIFSTGGNTSLAIVNERKGDESYSALYRVTANGKAYRKAKIATGWSVQGADHVVIGTKVIIFLGLYKSVEIAPSPDYDYKSYHRISYLITDLDGNVLTPLTILYKKNYGVHSYGDMTGKQGLFALVNAVYTKNRIELIYSISWRDLTAPSTRKTNLFHRQLNGNGTTTQAQSAFNVGLKTYYKVLCGGVATNTSGRADFMMRERIATATGYKYRLTRVRVDNSTAVKSITFSILSVISGWTVESVFYNKVTDPSTGKNVPVLFYTQYKDNPNVTNDYNDQIYRFVGWKFTAAGIPVGTATKISGIRNFTVNFVFNAAYKYQQKRYSSAFCTDNDGSINFSQSCSFQAGPSTQNANDYDQYFSIYSLDLTTWTATLQQARREAIRVLYMFPPLMVPYTNWSGAVFVYTYKDAVDNATSANNFAKHDS